MAAAGQAAVEVGRGRVSRSAQTSQWASFDARGDVKLSGGKRGRQCSACCFWLPPMCSMPTQHQSDWIGRSPGSRSAARSHLLALLTPIRAFSTPSVPCSSCKFECRLASCASTSSPSAARQASFYLQPFHQPVSHVLCPTCHVIALQCTRTAKAILRIPDSQLFLLGLPGGERQ